MSNTAAVRRDAAPRPPHIYVMSGPNGAGKSTLARQILPREIPFINADDIAQGLPPEQRDHPEMRAGRAALGRMTLLQQHRADFAVESTLAGTALARRLQRARRDGYTVHLYFIALRGADLAGRRVAERVRAGGHAIPAPVIRRRFQAGLGNLFRLYLPLADDWAVYDNSSNGLPRLVADRRPGGEVLVHEAKRWQSLRRKARHD